MWKNVNFLFEIGSEEIPAGYFASAIKNMSDLFEKKCAALAFDHGEVHVFATPRRIVLACENIADAQRAETLQMRGPAIDKAYNADGSPTKALEGFLRGNGVKLSDLSQVDTGKGIYVFAEKKVDPKCAAEVLPSLLTEIISELQFPKKMKWSTHNIQYPRPIRYLLAILNDKPLNFEVDGITASNCTRGHYVQSNSIIPIERISSYESQLEAHKVTLDQVKRKEMIRHKLQQAASHHGCELVNDEALLETVSYLVEDVHVVVCTFQERFLEIPDVVLIAEMREHQKYFALRKDGALSNLFCVIANNPESEFVRKGNERVITARFTDAGFFFEEDKKRHLADRIDQLKTVLFHKELGTIYDKVMRVDKVAAQICSMLSVDSSTRKKIERAVLLSKADLNTALVFEFTSLQGYIGKIYALRDGEDPEIAAAIEEHYRPRFQGDNIFSSVVSAVLSMSEKIDNLMGAWSVGNIPKGSQDPYALRRQGYSLVDTVINYKMRIDFKQLLASLSSNYKNAGGFVNEIASFLSTRAETRFGEDGIETDEIRSVLATGSFDFFELHNRALSLHEFRKDPSFGAMLAGFKRINNILSSFEKKNKDHKYSYSETLLVEDNERALASYFIGKRDEILRLSSGEDYSAIFVLLLNGKSLIDRYFDNIMVMSEDIKLRNNRLGMLHEIAGLFKDFVDFSCLGE